MTLGTDLALTGNLSLTNGILNTGANTLSLSPSSSVSRAQRLRYWESAKGFRGKREPGQFYLPIGHSQCLLTARR